MDAVPPSQPLCSIIVANYNGAPFLRATLASALAQSLPSLEVIVVDDRSSDDSLAVLAEIEAGDPRVRVVALTENGGPARARNRALAEARGRWIAVLDADDIMHPERLAILIGLAEARGCDAIADGFIAFSNATLKGEWLALDPALDWPRDGLDAAGYMNRSWTQPMGYLKPVIRAEALGGIRYDETLLVGEDFDLVVRFLLEGRRLLVCPVPLYLYRRHSASISHRFSVRKLVPLVEANDRLTAALAASGRLTRALKAELAHRGSRLRRALAFERLVEALKRRDPLGALVVGLRQPNVVAEFAAPLRARLARVRPGAPPAGAGAAPRVYGFGGAGAGVGDPSAIHDVLSFSESDGLRRAIDAADGNVARMIETATQEELGALVASVMQVCTAGEVGEATIVFDDQVYRFFTPYLCPGANLKICAPESKSRHIPVRADEDGVSSLSRG